MSTNLHFLGVGLILYEAILNKMTPKPSSEHLYDDGQPTKQNKKIKKGLLKKVKLLKVSQPLCKYAGNSNKLPLSKEVRNFLYLILLIFFI